MADLYPDAVKGPYVVPSYTDIADAPQAFMDFADSIPYGGLIQIVDAVSTPFTITSAMTGKLISAKIPDILFEFDPNLPDGFNAAVVSTSGDMYMASSVTVIGDVSIPKYSMGSFVKIGGTVIVSCPKDLSSLTTSMTVSNVTSPSYDIRPDDKNGVMLLTLLPSSTWTLSEMYSTGDILTFTNASSGWLDILADPAGDVTLYWGQETVASAGPNTKLRIAANSTVTIVCIPKGTGTHFAVSALDTAAVGA